MNASATVPGTFVYTPTSGTVLSVGTQILKVDFTPTDTATYNTTSKNVTINVLKATPTITWNNPADIISGTALSSAQLNAIASVPGTFTYTPASGTVLSTGIQTLHVDFTPTDTANYNSTSKDVTINVMASTLALSSVHTEVLPNPVVVGEPFTIKATVYYMEDGKIFTMPDKPDSSGEFVYFNVLDVNYGFGYVYTYNGVATKRVLDWENPLSNFPVGTHIVQTQVYHNGNWIGTGDNIYFQVIPSSDKKITPIITWNNPADIISGTALSITQLNATASIPGTFTYTPTSGTVLNAGTQTLKVDFTPTDTTNYTTASASVQINIRTPAQGIQQINTTVQNLNLNQDQANSLIVKLNAATQNLNKGNTQAASNELGAFVNEVQADIQSGKLSSSNGQTLIDAANTVINAIDPHATSVPEFPSVVVPIAAILGLLIIFGRKKE